MRTSSHGVIGAGGQSSFQPPWGLSLPPQPPSIYSAVRCPHTPLISPLLFSALFMHCLSDAAQLIPTRWDRDAAVWFHAGSFWHQAAQRGTAGPALRAGMRAGHAPSLPVDSVGVGCQVNVSEDVQWCCCVVCGAGDPCPRLVHPQRPSPSHLCDQRSHWADGHPEAQPSTVAGSTSTAFGAGAWPVRRALSQGLFSIQRDGSPPRHPHPKSPPF